MAVRSEATLRWCEDEVRVDRRLWPPCTRVTSLKPTMQERLLGSALSQSHGRTAAKLKRTPGRAAQQWTEEVYRNGSHGLTPMERVPGPPILMARAKKALPWRKRCLPLRSRWARRSQRWSRAPSLGRGSSTLQAVRRSARCHSKRRQMAWRGEVRACGVMRSNPGGRGHHANVARPMTSSALNRSRIAC